MSKRYRLLDYDLFIDMNKVKVSEGLFLVEMLDGYNKKEDLEKRKEDIKQDIRAFLLDILDVLNYKGIYLPIVLLVKTENKKTWEIIAGDQDWHRGEFYIIPEDAKKDEIEKAFLGKINIFEEIKVKRITKREVIEFLKSRKESLNKLDELGKKYYRLLIDEAIKILEDEEEEKAQDLFEIWKGKIESDLEAIIKEGEEHEKESI